MWLHIDGQISIICDSKVGSRLYGSRIGSGYDAPIQSWANTGWQILANQLMVFIVLTKRCANNTIECDVKVPSDQFIRPTACKVWPDLIFSDIIWNLLSMCNTSTSEQNGHHFAEIFKCIFISKKIYACFVIQWNLSITTTTMGYFSARRQKLLARVN